MNGIVINFMKTSGHSALPLFIVKVNDFREEAFLSWDDVTHYVLSTLGEIKESTKTTVIYEKKE